MQVSRSELQIKNFDIYAAGKAVFQVVGMAALTAMASRLAFPLPYTPVPVTLQSFFVVLSGILLGARRGALSQIVLIVMGISGLPVFAQPLPGYVVLMGPTAGYILGFIPAAFVSGWISERKWKLSSSFWFRFVAFFVASLFIFFPGVIWLGLYTKKSFLTALSLGFIPFIPGDLLKSFGAAGFSKAASYLRSN